MLMSVMLPVHVVIVPQYVPFSQLDWITTHLPLVNQKMPATDAFFVFLTVRFFRGLPRELTAAAHIDGGGGVGPVCSAWSVTAAPGLAAMSG